MSNRLFVFFCLFFVTFLDYSECSKAENKLYRDILTGYLKLARPVRYPRNVLKVHMKVFLQQILNLDGQNQIIEVNAWLKYVLINTSFFFLRVNISGMDGLPFAVGSSPIRQHH
ncbi:hypothetical protein B9Z55_024003 [Caenorhabditis nigoni]|uniref:Neurotransmitter-gated ion-channel ligand-binding domain-containing protein n=1 Tax=Caenorhabditis nigoni TaxID=1611254 RepID=A0A2G5SSU7_9PELO|nr:hypothetical protein B9Z55_024003 [Caenorhabditis nigoni]